MKWILAVSGGVDSMVMLDFCAKNFPREKLVVATFDHESRESSAKDAHFVSEVCSALEIPIYRGRLGDTEGFWTEKNEPINTQNEAKKRRKNLSEEEARKARYDFLFKVAFKEKGEILTAQHLDDLVESVAINLLRGTGPRGLAVLGRPGIRRPFLCPEIVPGAPWGRKEILRYAWENKIRFRLDPSNYSDQYLRNRVRERTNKISEERKHEMFRLWRKQRKIYQEIDQIIEDLIPEDLTFSREMFREIPDEVGREVLRAGLMRAGIRATGPKIEEFRQAILKYPPGKQFNLPEGRLVRLGKKSFQVRVYAGGEGVI